MNLDDAVEDYFRVDDLEVRHQEVMAKVFHLVNIFASGLGGASEGNIAMNNLVGHTALMLNQLPKYRAKPLGLLAWVARSLFETNLWIRYCLSGDAQMVRFGAAQIPDVRAIFSNLDGSAKACLGQEFMNTFGPDAKEAKSILKDTPEFGNLLETPNVANQVGQKQEYDAYYTLYSKLIHSTPWVLSGLSKKHDIQALRRCLMTKCLEYGQANYDLVAERFKVA